MTQQYALIYATGGVAHLGVTGGVAHLGYRWCGSSKLHSGNMSKLMTIGSCSVHHHTAHL